MHIYYLKYNNYYNRKFKREASLPDYLTYEVARTENLALWNPADGVETSIVANIDIPFGAAQPDYAVLQGDTIDDYINSRWFIMEMVQLRKGQYRVSLRRDVIADCIEVLENTTNFLAQRGFVEQNNKLVLQPEDINVNRIKTSETLIKDETGVPWLIGYLNKSVQTKTISGALDVEVSETYDNLTDWPYYKYTTEWFNGYVSDDSTGFTLYWNAGDPFAFYWNRSWDIRTYGVTQNSDTKEFANPKGYQTQKTWAITFPSLEEVTNAFKNISWINDIKNNFKIHTFQETEAITSLEDSVISVGRDENKRYYQIVLTSEQHNHRETINRSEAESEAPTIRNICENTLRGTLEGDSTDSHVYIFYTTGMRYKLSLIDITTEKGFKYTIPADRPHLNDAPYDMFAIPYGAYNGLGDKTLAMKAASAAIADFNVGSSSELYDIQLLPYKPTLSETVITDITNNLDNNKVIGKIYWATESSFSKTILLDKPIGVKNKKIDHICDKYRLVSPNYSGQFEFTAAANNGISGFKIDATYLPINPYIRIAPLFGGLYGREFGDARGLICGGDFSLPAVNDAWVSYQQNNKNYNAIFNRNIESLEFTNNINRRLDRIGAGVGIVQGAASGASAGMVGGPITAVAGGVTGLTASLFGGIADIALNESLRQEQLSLTRDLQSLNIGNIQAQPYSLAKTTSFTANNKIFPILEYYTCSPEEKALVEAFLENNSFNLGAVIPFKTLLTTRYNEKARQWIQGRVVEFPNNFGEDYHFAAVLNQELAQGYSFKEYTEV